MNKDEAVKMIAGIHLDTYNQAKENNEVLQNIRDNFNESNDEIKDNISDGIEKISHKLDENFKALDEEIKKGSVEVSDFKKSSDEHLLTVVDLVNKKISALEEKAVIFEENEKLLAKGLTDTLKEVRSSKRKVFQIAKDTEGLTSGLKILYVGVAGMTALLVVGFTLLYGKNISCFNKLDTLIKGKRDIVAYSNEQSQNELNSFIEDGKVYEWSELTITSLNDLLEDMSAMRDKFGDSVTFKYVTNKSTEVTFLGHDLDASKIKEVWDTSLFHNVKKKVEKVPVTCFAGEAVTLEEGSIFITYIDMN